MIKKHTILTLILSLITTSTFSIIPESITKTFAFFQDTRKSFLQSILEFVREKVQNTGCYLYEGKKVKAESNVNDELLNSEFLKDRNQEDYFVEENMKLFKEAKERSNTFLEQLSESEEKIIQEIKSYELFKIPQEILDLMWNCFENPEKGLRALYQKRLELYKLDFANPDLAKIYGWWENASSQFFWNRLAVIEHYKKQNYIDNRPYA